MVTHKKYGPLPYKNLIIFQLRFANKREEQKMNVYEETQLILHKYKIQANKSLGQNFLVDDNVIDEIIRSSNIDKQDLIIEIGPGLGVLTNRLLQESNNVIAVELDKRMVNILQDRFILNISGQAESKLEIINEDILKINLNQLIEEKRSQTEIKQVKIVANLPYYISTPIIMKLLENMRMFYNYIEVGLVIV